MSDTSKTTKTTKTEPEATVVATVPSMELDKQASKTIRKYALLSVIPGVIPMPLLDLAAISALQLKMLHELSNIHGVPFSGYWGKSSIAALVGTATTGGMYPTLASFIKVVPFVGHYAGAASLSTMAAASTYAVGKVFNQHFASGGTFLTFNAEKGKRDFERKVEEYKADHAVPVAA